tara:strand:- start:4914 stop:5786 length:873 start_codon:yes stop_codon:yes gene_type:complete
LKERSGPIKYTNLLFNVTDEGIAIVTLNHPEKLNALNDLLLESLNNVLDKINADDNVRVVLLLGAGKSFSTGFDISPGQKSKEATETQQWEEMNFAAKVVTRIRDLPQPTLAAVQGYCLGAGHTLAHSCDLIIAGEDAKFGEPEIRHVAPTPAPILPFVMPMRQAYWLYYTGDTINAKTALELSMINRVVPTDRLEDESLKVAKRIATVPPFASQMMKKSIQVAYNNMGYSKTLEDHLMIRQIQTLTPDVTEREMLTEIRETQGFQAFLDARDGPFNDDVSSEPPNQEAE